MGNIVKTAKCRFCGQMTQIEADEKLTAAQACLLYTSDSVPGIRRFRENSLSMPASETETMPEE